MSTPSPAPRDIRQRLRTARLRWTTAEVIRGLLLVASGVGIAFLLGVGAEGALWLGVGLRTALFWLLAALALGLVGVLVLPALLRGLGVLPGMDDASVAHRADRFREGAGDRLLALRDLQSSGESVSALQAAAVAALGEEVADVPVERAEDARGLWRAVPWALGPALGFVLALVVVPGPFEAAAERLLSPGEAFYPPASFALVLQPGDVEVVRGESVEVTTRPTGEDWPLDATLELRREGEDVIEETRLLLGDDGLWRHTVEDVRQSAEYRVRALGVVTEWADIRMVARPLVRGLNVVVAPPSYSGRPARSLPEGVGDVSGLVGSTVRLSVGLAGEPAARGEVRIRWEDSTLTRVPLRIGSEGGTARFPLRQGGQYSLHLETASGVSNTNPARYSLGVLGDGAPQIALVDGASGPLDARGRRLSFRISDDFGFSGGSLIWRVVRGDARGPLRRAALPVRTRPLGQDVSVTFRPANVGPGDVVEFFGEVVDNGPRRQRARTPVTTLRFPSLAQRIDELEAQRDSTRDDLEELRDNAREASERFERFREDLRRNPDPDWEDQRQIEELRRQQDELSRQSEALQQRMQQLQQNMQESGMADPETLRKLEQMQEVMRELDSPELREALRRLQEAMEKLDVREMMQQAEEAEFNEEEFRQRLDRAMELLERFETAVDLEEAAALADELAETEAEIQEKTEALENASQEADSNEAPEGDTSDSETPEASGDTPPQNTPEEREALAQEQERASETAEALEQELEELRQRMEEMRGQQGEQSLQEAMEQMQQNGGLPEQMQENAEQIRDDQLQDAQQQQQEMRRQLRRMSEKLQESSAQMQGQQNQIDTARLRAALEDVLTLSAEQERLAGETSETPSRSPALRPLARRQGELRTGLQHVSDSLRSIGRTVPQLGRKITSTTTTALREMGGAVEEFAEQRAGPAAARQRSAMTSLNELAVLLADLLSQLQNQQQQGGGQGQGTPQQMQQMGRQQQQLNQQIQQMLNQSAGQRLSRDEQQRMRQLAEQQEAIRRQLKQMLENAGGEGSGGAGGGLDEQTRSQLRRIEEQMGEAAEQLRRGRVDPATLPRQQNILQRLLEAERSANEQGREEKREAEAARDVPPSRSGRVPPRERPADRIRRDMIRALESGFSPDFQDLIKEYFGRVSQRLN